MRLVYLDHSTIVTLERTLKRAPKRFASFVENWRRADCALAISFVHVLEIAGSKHADARANRIRVLHALGPARTGLLPNSPAALQQLAGREVFAAIGRLVGREDLLSVTDKHWIGFPSELPNSIVGTVLQGLLTAKMRQVYGQFGEAVTVESKARSRPANTKRVDHRLRELQSGPLSEKEAALARANLQDVMNSGEWRDEVLGTFPPDVRERAAEDVRRWMENAFEQMISAGPRESFAAAVNADLALELKSFTHDLIVQHIFRTTVQTTASETLKVADPAALDPIVEAVTLESCPGTWLRYKVEFELEKARTTWEAGATYDLLHLAHLPYVDLMFTDAEIAENTRKVLRRRPLPEALNGIAPPVSVAGTVEAIEDLILMTNESSDG
jgi:hypothetical protein